MGKRMISMPDELLERIDEDASRRGETRSAWLRAAAHDRRQRAEPAEIRRRLESIRAWADEHGGSFDSGDSIRAERDWLDARDRTR